MNAISRIMQDRIKDVVRSLITDLENPATAQIPVRDLALRSMAFAGVPQKHLPLVLKLISNAYKAGQINHGK